MNPPNTLDVSLPNNMITVRTKREEENDNPATPSVPFVQP